MVPLCHLEVSRVEETSGGEVGWREHEEIAREGDHGGGSRGLLSELHTELNESLESV